MPAPSKAAAEPASAQGAAAKPAAGSAAAGLRAEFPPLHYWRRWCADAEPPRLPDADRDPAAAELAAEMAALPTLAAATADAPEVSDEGPYRVLIVEDDPSQALFAESVLMNAGMQAEAVAVAGEVMAALERFRPDLVLMDLHMPGMDGSELTTLIRAHGAFAHVPIVFLTGDTDPERQFELLQIGADDFLSKPVRPRHLIAAVQSRVRRARQQRRQRGGDGRHPVTGLHTRADMLQRLAAAIPGPPTGALFFVEIEGTTALRDRFGYATLEIVLTDAGRRLGELAGDNPAARLNDNTFLVHAPTLSADALPAWARTVRDGLGRQAFSVNGELLRLRALVGYAALSHPFQDPGSAMAAAEEALREARTQPTGVAGYLPPPPVDDDQHQALAGAIAGALAEQRFELAFQPIVAVAGGDEAQYQTLLRLREADGSLRTAAEFLPAAEAAGQIYDIDRRALELAIETLRTRRAANRPVRLFVSQSPRTLTRDGVAAWLVDTLAVLGIEGPSLVIDVRQDDALIHAVALQEFCTAMVPAGIQLCLSQYQAGAESDALLTQLPLGFVRLATRYSTKLDDGGVRDEMRAAIERAHRLGLQVIGQHVEDPQAAATLWMSGIDYIQGNLVQRAAGELDFDFHHSVL